jgi:anti-anti-sigma factor
VKCYELTKCSEQERNACYVWNSFRANPQEMENIKCWVLKGVYNEGNKDKLQKCRQCKYYLLMNKDESVVSDFAADVAVIACQGTLNNDRTRALEKVWATLKENKKVKILLDLSNVNNVYSCGLGAMVKIHKEADAAGGKLVTIGVKGYVEAIFTSTKLSKILHIAADRRQAAAIFEDLKKKEEAETVAAEAAKRAAEEAAKPKVVPPKKRIPCWEYFKNHNPRNATVCDECFKKISPTKEPCWIVEGMIEGVSFQYVNEDCESCPYFMEFGAAQVHPGSSPDTEELL